jgi:hypothetical protein
MSAVIVWRCVDCAAVDQVIAQQPTQMLAIYRPKGWTLTIDDEHLLVRCELCSVTDDAAEEEQVLDQVKG